MTRGLECPRGEMDRVTRAGPLPYALAMARLGWWTFPLLPRDKRPDGQLAPHGCRSASCDERQLREWWTDRPDHGIGLACGPSGLVVLDVDPRNGGDEHLRELVAGRDWPRTPCAKTGGGGWHFLYRAPYDASTGEVLRLRGKLAAGIDVKGDGGYIAVAPSVHPSGERYLWSPEGRPTETPLADLPGWALEMLRQPEPEPPPPPRERGPGPSPMERASHYLARMDASIAGSGGHDALWRAALALVRGFALSEGEALSLLRLEFNPRCRPPWNVHELTHKVQQASGSTRVTLGWMLDNERETR